MAFDRLLQDLRFAACTFRRDWNFSLAVILSLALGIGGTCAFFSVIYAVVIHPMYKDVSRIIVPTVSTPDSEDRRPPLEYQMADFPQMQKGLRAFENIILTGSRTAVTGGSSPRNVNVMDVSSNYFEFFDTPALLGRPFFHGDVPQPQSPPPLAVIGYKLWTQEFDGSPGVIGSDLRLGNDVYKIIGVMPKTFTWFDTDVFTPARLRPEKGRSVSIYLKLRKGATLHSADAELQAMTEQVAKQDPKHYPKLPFHMNADPFQDWVLGKLPGQLLILMAAVSMLLLIACGNVSVLMLARSQARKQEIAMRFALGATSGRIIRQLLTESLLLSLSGCALSVLFAWRGLPALLAALPETSIPHEAAVGLNLPVFAFATVVSLATGIGAGLAPTLALVRDSVHSTVKSGSRTTAHSRFRISGQTMLVTAEIGLSAMLLIGCAVAIRTLVQLTHVDLGYNPRNVAVLSVSLTRNTKLPWLERRAYYDRLQRALAETPGVLNVTAANGAVPPMLDFEVDFAVPGLTQSSTASIAMGLVGADYFKTLRTPLISGRVFTLAEVEQGSQVAVINDLLAKQLIGSGRPAIDSVIELPSPQVHEDASPPNGTRFYRVVGVVDTIENQNLMGSAKPAIYLPYTQLLTRYETFLVRTGGDPRTLEHTLQKRLHAFVDADQPLAEFDTLDHLLALSSLGDAESSGTLFSIFAFVAVVLAGFGLYSVLSFSVAQRNKEFAIRRALGAQSEQVAGMILKWVLAVTGAGILLGISGTFAFGKLLAYYEPGWQTNDPFTLAAVAALLLGINLVAILPALVRALGIVPETVLRAQ